MKKLVNGKYVELSAAEADACTREWERGKAEALANVKRALIDQIDARLAELQRRSWMAGAKAEIMEATSVEEARQVFAAIQWRAPEALAQPVNGHHVQVVEYDDRWIREALAEVAKAIAASVYDDTEIREWLENLERRLATLETAPLPLDPLLEQDMPPPPEPSNDVEPEPMPPVVGDWREAIKRVDDEPEGSAEDFSIGMEADPEPEPETVILDAPPAHEAVAAPIQAEPPAAPPPQPVPQSIVVTEHKTVKDETWGRAQIHYETAIQAINGNSRARALLMQPAARRGISVDDLAQEILKERDDLVQRVMSEL